MSMSDDARKRILAQADRLLKQSRTLRNMADGLRKESGDLLKESDVVRDSAKQLVAGPKARARSKRVKRR